MVSVSVTFCERQKITDPYLIIVNENTKAVTCCCSWNGINAGVCHTKLTCNGCSNTCVYLLAMCLRSVVSRQVQI